MNMKLLIKFLQDSKGEPSSKRLGFLMTIATAIFLTLISTAVLLYKNKFELVINLLDSIWTASCAFAGIIATEFFTKNKKN